MRVIGEIVRLQVQREPLKVGVAPRRRYDPTPIQPVAALTLQPDGVEGWTDAGEQLLDVHNVRHPRTRNRGQANGISIGFTSHYARMRDRFGAHLARGIAGESLLVETSERFTEADLAADLMIETAEGEEIPLTRVMVAAPCVEFSRWCLQFPEDDRPDQRVTEALKFLHQGMRGYYASYEGEPARVGPGSRLLCP